MALAVTATIRCGLCRGGHVPGQWQNGKSIAGRADTAISREGGALMKALVVDDDLTTRIVLQEILSEYAEVHCSVDGSEAVLAYGRALECGEPYDPICMDVPMPVMGGLEALKPIRQKEETCGSSGPR